MGVRPGGRRGVFLSAVVGVASLNLTAQHLPDHPGKETFESVCSLCHSPAAVMGKQWTKAQWEAKVIEMLQEEPDVTAEERATIVEYLAASFKPGGKIYINDAAAKDLVTLVEVSADAANAIVQYRDAHGRFKTIDDFRNVPALGDEALAKLAAKKERFEY